MTFDAVVNSRARKLLVERSLRDPCLDLLRARLVSTRQATRMSALVTIRYIFDFKHKTRSPFQTTQCARVLTEGFQDSNAILQLINIAYGDYESFLQCLNNSIDDPLSTRLTISNICFLMRTQKGCRGYYAENVLFKAWRENPQNPLYSTTSVEGIVVVHADESIPDFFPSEIQQFIYYISEENWPLDSSLPQRVQDRFWAIWAVNTDTPVLPFQDPTERWFSDRDSEGEDDEGEVEEYYRGTEELTGGALDLLEEPETFTPEDLIAYLNVAEEAGLASQDRRRNARRLQNEN
jgi:hypothetical protein